MLATPPDSDRLHRLHRIHVRGIPVQSMPKPAAARPWDRASRISGLIETGE
jgi:hypothetical protein